MRSCWPSGSRRPSGSSSGSTRPTERRLSTPSTPCGTSRVLGVGCQGIGRELALPPIPLGEGRGEGDSRKPAQETPSWLTGCTLRDYGWRHGASTVPRLGADGSSRCLLYTSDAADDLLCVDLGG